MKVIDVYSQYFKGDCTFNGVKRRGALVRLTATSEEGNIRYDVGLTFFPHVDSEDFGVSYDARQEEMIYSAKGRRSKKREEALLEDFRKHVDALADRLDGKVFWDSPLRDARWG